MRLAELGKVAAVTALVACTGQQPSAGSATPTAPEPPRAAPSAVVERPSALPRWIDLDIADDWVAARGCAVERSGALWCWGSEPTLLAGARPTDRPRSWRTRESAGPSQVAGVSDARAVAVSSEQVCRIDGDGRVRCVRRPPEGSWREVAGIEGATAIEVDGERGCALEASGALRCWQEGGGATPVADGVTDFDLGGHGGCALLADGELGCWSQAVQSGTRRGPLTRRGRVRARDLAIGGDRWLWLLDEDGRVRRTDPFSDHKELPWDEYGEVADAVEIAAARDHVCVRTSSGAARCRGHNTHGQLGDGTSLRREEFVVAAAGGGEELALGELRSCVRDLDTIACAGLDRVEDAAINDEDADPPPQHTIPGLRATALAAAQDSTCAIDQVGALRCWGSHKLDGMETAGERLGIAAVSEPTLAAEDERGLRGLWSQGEHLYWVDGGGRLRLSVWSAPKSGEAPRLALLDAEDRDHAPLRRLDGDYAACGIAEASGKALSCGVFPGDRSPVPGIRGPIALAADHRLVCAVDHRGAVICAEIPDLYEDVYTTVVPARVPGIRGARAIASAASDFCALLGSGHVRCFSAHGERKSAPEGERERLEVKVQRAQDTGLREVASIFGNHRGFGSVDCSGRVRRWHFNGEEVVDEPTPTLTAAVVEVVAGEEHFCARDVDGAVTCWGADDRGQLGRLPAAVHLELTPLLLPSAAP
ncbi:MAG: hypothetical protein H6710_12020 [Myxococcales bacterium]|nr:hypothetical protein [Myxococcales bacterium]